MAAEGAQGGLRILPRLCHPTEGHSPVPKARWHPRAEGQDQGTRSVPAPALRTPRAPPAARRGIREGHAGCDGRVPSPAKIFLAPQVLRGPPGALITPSSIIHLAPHGARCDPPALGLNLSAPKRPPPQITPQTQATEPPSRSTEPPAPRAAPTLGEGPGDELVEGADHSAQLPLAALLALAHGSSSQRWGGTRPQPPQTQPPNSPRLLRAPGDARGRTEPSQPAASPWASAAGAAALRGGQRQRGSLQALLPGGRQAAGKFCAGMVPGGRAASQKATRDGSPQAEVHQSSASAAGQAVGCQGETPGAVPTRCPLCKKGAGRGGEQQPGDARGWGASGRGRRAPPGWQSPGLPPARGPPLGTSSPQEPRQVGMATRRLHRSRWPMRHCCIPGPPLSKGCSFRRGAEMESVRHPWASPIQR